MNSIESIWKQISCILKYAQFNEESIYQAAIAEIFIDYLGWPNERVIREYAIQMGSTKKVDMVLLDSQSQPIIAIEVKCANASSTGIEQLGSYMDRCNPRLIYGITIKDSINLFYDENTGRSLHSLDDAILSCKLNDLTNLDGIKFVELLNYQNFNKNALKSYCENVISNRKVAAERNTKLQEIRELLNGETGRKIIQESICNYLLSAGIIKIGDESIVTEITSDISLNKDVTKDPIFPLAKPTHSTAITYEGKYQFIPSKDVFIERINKGIGYKHFVLKDDRIETKPWGPCYGRITSKNLKGNITSCAFYKENKQNIKKIILSIYNDSQKDC